jgi:hypothetical protein
MPIIEKIVAWILSCRRCLYTVAVIALCMGSWWAGHHQSQLECRAGELAAKLRNQQADLEAAQQSAADEKKRAATIEAYANDQRSKDAAYIATLVARPACALDELDLGRVPHRRQSWPGRAKPAAGAG